MNPAEYVAEKNLSQQDFAACFDPPVSQGLVSQWFRGVTRMTLQQAIQASRFSEGAITVEECAELFERPPERNACTNPVSVEVIRE